MVNDSVIQRLQELGELLSCALDSEFNSLKERDMRGVEEQQARKVALLEEILSHWERLPMDWKNGELGDERFNIVKTSLKSCKEKHERNDIVLRRQIDEVKTLLDNLQTQKSKSRSDVYNKMGKIIS